jgi:hypothetical protein
VKKWQLLLGPELLWALFFLLSLWLAGRNVPPTPAGNAFLERFCWIGAFLGTALTFTIFLVPGTSRGWLFARVVVAVVIGGSACLFKLVEAINYNDSRNSGTFGFWLYGILASTVALVLGAVITLALLSRRHAN